MRITKLLLICMCCLTVAPAVWGQTANSSAKPGILGYLDPNTGAFRPVPAADETTDALTTFGGTITVSFAITVKSTGLTNVSCTIEVSVVDALYRQPSLLWRERHRSRHWEWDRKDMQGNLSYSWPRNPGQRQYDNPLLRNWGWFSIRTGSEEQSSLSLLDTCKVPADGATTALTAAVTL